MRFNDAVDQFLADKRSEGTINSDRTEVSYRACLDQHSEDVGNLHPSVTDRDDVKGTLRRWRNPNTKANKLSILKSFYDWAMEEGVRSDNPARQVRRPKRREPQVYRLTFAETRDWLEAAQGPRERRAMFLGVCAGLRRQELIGLQGRHLRRGGYVWVSPDIGKGGRERWVPVIADLAPIVAEIQEHVGDDEYVLPAQRWRDVGVNQAKVDKRRHPCSPQAIYFLTKRVGKRAGIHADLHPHLMRHAFGDHIARYAGMRNAQFLLGHADVGTTETYVGKPTLDELADSIAGFSFGTNTEASTPQGGTEHTIPSPRAVSPLKATTGIEPVVGADRTLERLRKPAVGSLGIGRPCFG